MQDQEKLQAIYDILSTNLSWIKSADSKATLIFTVVSAMLGVITGISSNMHDMSTPAILTAILLLVSIIALAFEAFPRLKGQNDSVIYFCSIAATNEASYVQKISSMGSDELLEDFAKQAYRNAIIAKEKYGLIRIAVIAMFLSLPFWLTAIWIYASTKL